VRRGERRQAWQASKGAAVKLLKVKVSHFKNILNSEDVNIQPDVTCVVGKNESGKTAFLQALHRFNPAQPNVSFNAQRQYPAWLEKQHRRQRDLESHAPVTAYFWLEDPEWLAVESQLGKGSIKSREIKISRTYGNEFTWEPGIVEHIVVAHILSGISLDAQPLPTSMEGLGNLIESLQAFVDPDESKTQSVRQKAVELTARKTALGAETLNSALWKLLMPFIPKFFYFDEYSQLIGVVKSRELLSKAKDQLTSAEVTAR